VAAFQVTKHTPPRQKLRPLDQRYQNLSGRTGIYILLTAPLNTATYHGIPKYIVHTDCTFHLCTLDWRWSKEIPKYVAI